MLCQAVLRSTGDGFGRVFFFCSALCAIATCQCETENSFTAGGASLVQRVLIANYQNSTHSVQLNFSASTYLKDGPAECTFLLCGGKICETICEKKFELCNPSMQLVNTDVENLI